MGSVLRKIPQPPLSCSLLLSPITQEGCYQLDIVLCDYVVVIALSSHPTLELQRAGHVALGPYVHAIAAIVIIHLIVAVALKGRSIHRLLTHQDTLIKHAVISPLLSWGIAVCEFVVD